MYFQAIIIVLNGRPPVSAAAASGAKPTGGESSTGLGLSFTYFPAFSSVLFLNRCRGGLLAVVDAPPCDHNPALAPDRFDADLVRPWPNRLAVFPGDVTHGVLDARGDIPHGRLAVATPLRLALVMNWWTRRPSGVPRFEEAGRYARLRCAAPRR